MCDPNTSTNASVDVMFERVCFLRAQHEILCDSQNDTSNITCATGLIVRYGNNNYVISRRMPLIGSSEICMYHVHSETGENIVLESRLEIIFQVIEYDLVIMVSPGATKFDGCTGSGADTSAVAPNVDNQYYMVKAALTLPILGLYWSDVKVVRLEIFDETYTPSYILYEIEQMGITTCEDLSGAIIFDTCARTNIVGMITVQKEKLRMLPMITISKIMSDFVKYKQNINKYVATYTLPFKYYCAQTRCTIKENYSKIKKDDVVTAVNDQAIIMNGCKCKVYSPILKTNIPIDIYLNMFASPSVTVTIDRAGEIINKTIKLKKYKSGSIPCTALTHYYPEKKFFPYVRLNDHIIFQLTYETVECYSLHESKNYDNILDHVENGFGENIFIILSNEEIRIGRVDIIRTVGSINGTQIKSLGDIIGAGDHRNCKPNIEYNFFGYEFNII